jgi:ABC-type Fe3+ transport system permease subunit
VAVPRPLVPVAALSALWLAATVGVPLVGLALLAGEPGPPTRGATLLAIMGDSVMLAAASTAVALACAYPIARAVPAPLLLTCAMISPLARAIGALRFGLPPGTGSIALARLAGDVPLAALLLRVRLQSRPQSWLDAAADLGAGPWRRFWTVEWPHLRPAYALAAAIVLLVALGDATTGALAGGGKRYTLALALREAVLTDAHPRRAATIAALFVAIAVPCAWGLSRGLRDAAQGRRGREGVAPGIGWSVLAIACGLPLAGLVAPAIAEPWGVGDDIVLGQVPATLTSAGIAAIVAAAIGCAAGVGLPPRLGPALVLPLALPPAVYGAAWLSAAQAVGWGPGTGLTFVALLPGQVAIAYAGAVLAAAGSRRLADSARDLGAGAAARVRWLWWPLLAPTGVALALVALAFAVGDAGAAAFTSGPGGSTLAIGLEIVGRGGELGVVPRWALILAALPLLLAAVAGLIRRA